MRRLPPPRSDALRQRLDHGHDGIDDGRGIARLGRYSLLGEDRAILGDHRAGDLGPPDINPNGIHGDRVYRRRDSVVSACPVRVERMTPTGTKGVAVKQFDVPALVGGGSECQRHRPARCRGRCHPRSCAVRDPDSRRRLAGCDGSPVPVRAIALAKGLVASGVEPGDKIGLMAKTRYEWTLIDFATPSNAGAVLVPIYETSAPSQIL